MCVLASGAVAGFVELEPTAPPLSLSRSAAGPVGGLQGAWEVATGSLAGFRLKVSVLGFSNDVVGRTHEVAGSVEIRNDSVRAARFRIGLRSIKIGSGLQSQFAEDLGTTEHPYAIVSLLRPVRFGPDFSSGKAVFAAALAQFSLHGESHSVRFQISSRRAGTGLQIAGSIPVVLSEWGIRTPKGFGFIGSLANSGVAEFFLILKRHRG